MSKEAFYSLLDRYLKGKCSEEERKLVEEWYAMLDDETPEIKESELALISARMKDTLEEKINPTVSFTERTRSGRVIMFAIAASVIGILIMAGYFISAPIETPGFVHNTTVTIVDEHNETLVPKKITLSDGSVVTLAPGSALKYPQEFVTDKREVQLTGTSFFEIARDTEHPFRVFSENLITQVLGTSFTIQSDESTQAHEVSVRTGKVSVSRNTQGQQQLYPGAIRHNIVRPDFPNGKERNLCVVSWDRIRSSKRYIDDHH